MRLSNSYFTEINIYGFRTARTTDILPSNKEFWRMKAEIRRIKAAKEETVTALETMV